MTAKAEAARPASLLDTLAAGSDPSVDAVLKSLLARELRDTGEENADDSKSAAALRLAIKLVPAVRQLLADRGKEEDKDAGRGDGPEVITFELNKFTGSIAAKGKRFDPDAGCIVIQKHQELIVRLDRGQIAFFRRQVKHGQPSSGSTV